VGNHVLLDAPANLGLRPPAELDGHDDFRHLGTAGDLADIDELRPYVRDSDVLVLGVRTAESSHLRTAGIPFVTSERLMVSEPLPSSVFAGLDGFRIHVDIDVLDPAHVSAVDSPDPAGSTPIRRCRCCDACSPRRARPASDAGSRSSTPRLAAASGWWNIGATLLWNACPASSWTWISAPGRKSVPTSRHPAHPIVLGGGHPVLPARHAPGPAARRVPCGGLPRRLPSSPAHSLTLEEPAMPHAVDFATVSTAGLESSPVAGALAGLRANEARYFKNKYDHVFATEPASDAASTVDRVSRILEEERGIVIASPPLEATEFEVEGIRMAYVFYESGLSINVMYTIEDGGKRAVGFKLSDGMAVPEELGAFKFARQKSKLAGTIRGSYFVIKNEY
jgi:hypothetical protein